MSFAMLLLLQLIVEKKRENICWSCDRKNSKTDGPSNGRRLHNAFLSSPTNCQLKMHGICRLFESSNAESLPDGVGLNWRAALDYLGLSCKMVKVVIAWESADQEGPLNGVVNV